MPSPGPRHRDCNPERMFVFFSNKLGCLGSVVVSAVITLVLLLLFGII